MKKVTITYYDSFIEKETVLYNSGRFQIVRCDIEFTFEYFVHYEVREYYNREVMSFDSLNDAIEFTKELIKFEASRH